MANKKKPKASPAAGLEALMKAIFTQELQDPLPPNSIMQLVGRMIEAAAPNAHFAVVYYTRDEKGAFDDVRSISDCGSETELMRLLAYITKRHDEHMAHCPECREAEKKDDETVKAARRGDEAIN